MSKSSEQLAERALARVPGGVNSNVRLSAAEYFFARGEGARIWDVDGKEYIDYALGQGPMLLGHSHAGINGAVAMACADGMVYGAQHPLEVLAAERFCEAVGWAERVRFGMTGSEVVHAALRLARAVTGREQIVRVTGHYHGWGDTVLLDLAATEPVPASVGQPAAALDGTRLVPWSDVDALRRALADGDVAAVIMEPVMFNSGAFPPAAGYLQEVRRACDEHGTILIFDEVITGFRLALGGAVEHFGVTPDLATYGKAMAGGWPVAAFAGRADLMDRLGDGTINHAGTFNASVMASAAVVATLAVLEADPPYERLNAYGVELMAQLGELAQRRRVPLRIEGLPVAFTVALEPAVGGGALQLHRALADAGIWTTGRGLWFVSDAHRTDELRDTVARVDAALARLGSASEHGDVALA
ncbi:aspartate aminotransferase family protein [Conexibacter sp. CPCC 206217]|uniref:aspartate aminotransferase family protein n=1 Tax=Conexibacter sp. CPCC 206217 TaxID=3064574 RepID=UPI002716B81B|nr:aminotransferase class III-fold pyridoxal phosphate-dependent enzyme [Conexibacter sp. CPCC 206217]MDO8210340.1 aminotransferase class III-fold pyridoxal phosphate-dependent enzyme [Conexibacter sp. CPCC 206217]